MQGPWTCQKQQVIPDMPQSQWCFWQSCVCRVGQGTQPSPSLPPQPLDRSPHEQRSAHTRYTLVNIPHAPGTQEGVLVLVLTWQLQSTEKKI